MTNEISNPHESAFEQIKRRDEKGNEYWTTRKLSKTLQYSEYRHFLPVVERAKEACANSGQKEKDHFEELLEMVEIGSGAKRHIDNIKLSRYACYLIVQNADPAKEVVALGKPILLYKPVCRKYSSWKHITGSALKKKSGYFCAMK